MKILQAAKNIARKLKHPSAAIFLKAGLASPAVDAFFSVSTLRHVVFTVCLLYIVITNKIATCELSFDNVFNNFIRS